MRRRFLIYLTLPSLVLIPACGGEDNQRAKENVALVKGTDYAFLAPDKVEGGVLTMRFSNVGKEFHEYAIGRLKNGSTVADLRKELARENLRSVDEVPGVPNLSPGEEIAITRKLKPGNYVFLCYIPTAKGVPHYKLGMLKPFEVAGTSSAELPKPAATVTASDKAIEVPALRAGKQTLELRNSAGKPRGFEFLRLKTGKTFDDVKALFGSSRPPTVAEAPASFLGAIQSIPPGSSIFLDVTLEAGKKYLFLDDESGLMKEFTVS